MVSLERHSIRRLYTSAIIYPAFRKALISTPLVRDLAWRYISGETVASAVDVARRLNAFGITATMSYLGTHVRRYPDALAAADMAIHALHLIDQCRVQSNISVKLSQVGLDIDEEVCRTQMRRILDCASRFGNFVRIDMEESTYTERTIKILSGLMQTYGPAIVGSVAQSYLRAPATKVSDLIAAGVRIRLVKGGYWESAAVVYRKRADIDAAFARDIGAVLRRGAPRPAIATHDARFIGYTQQLAAANGVVRRDYEFQMLYGVRPDLQRDLARKGYCVRCYIPYGTDWSSYVLGCVRRTAATVFGKSRAAVPDSRDALVRLQ